MQQSKTWTAYAVQPNVTSARGTGELLIARTLLVLGLLLVFGGLEGQSSQPPATSVFDLFNREAAEIASEAVHRYSKDLTQLIVPAEDRSMPMDSFTNRLTQREIMARAGQVPLIPEADVAHAFDELMKTIGEPTIRTNLEALRRVREQGSLVFPSLFSKESNGTNCNPGEAIFLLYLLISNDGTPSVVEIESARRLRQRLPGQGGRGAFAVGHMETAGSRASAALSLYLSRHAPDAKLALFNNLSGLLHF
jgi:hypothetical protein